MRWKEGDVSPSGRHQSQYVECWTCTAAWRTHVRQTSHGAKETLVSAYVIEMLIRLQQALDPNIQMGAMEETGKRRAFPLRHKRSD